MLECKICNLEVAEFQLLFSNEFWRIRHSQETNIIGYFILEPQRHFLDLSEASAAELMQYGPLLAEIMKAQREILKCQRVYTFSLAEAVPHFHVHVIPRAKNFMRAYVGRGIMSYPTVPAANPALVDNAVQIFKAQMRRNNSDL
ncbi:MAG: HIT domain-containing protein [Candidatus Obscuribacterales bacterium]|nr:HIT domain-containing protein [Candidatus Obscuribacterales bacterium]